MTLSVEHFPEFFAAVHNGQAPFPWQTRLVKRVCDGGWPKAIALPTAAGKTGCIDIAVFSLACSARRQPRRIFFVVDRRIVVDQAFLHARNLANLLAGAMANRDETILQWVADALAGLGGEARPLEAYALRGGIYRETAWARSPIQPMVVTSTVDQVGSRLLFRGYGVSDSMKPVHAGLVGNDALILLDEAHCSHPFHQTVQAVARFRGWADDPTEQPPFGFVSITATPAGELPEDEVERDRDDDRNDPVLGPRLRAEKPAALVVAEKARKSKWRGELVKELAKQARQLMGQSLGAGKNRTLRTVTAVGVVVNRVATARELAAELRKPETKRDPDASPRVVLLTGRMRPVDRDDVLGQIRGLFSGSKDDVAPVYVVATQCIEVGADLDFHALVSECASLDALRQRFGRLNRVAARPTAKAVIVIRGDQAVSSEDDPIYGESLNNTWQWMKQKATGDVIDFGVVAMRHSVDGTNSTHLNVQPRNAPVLFPSHLDCWVQTHPVPTPDPNPAVFLHGPQESFPDVQVAFRADLGDDGNRWADVVALCPPSSAECLPVPLNVFKKWLAAEEAVDTSGDVEGEPAPETADESVVSHGRIALCWKGAGAKETTIVDRSGSVRPGDTFVIACDADGIAGLGDFLPGGPVDRAETAFMLSRAKPIVRLQGLNLQPEDPDFDEKLGDAVQAKLDSDFPEWPVQARGALVETRRMSIRPIVDVHPLGGYVVRGRRRLPTSVILPIIPHFVEQDGETFLDDSEANESPKSGRAVSLYEHCVGVAYHSGRFADACGLDKNVYTICGLFHDVGKLDPRNQAMLKALAPRLSTGEPLAKSGTFGSGNRDVHRYPAGARHELLSAAMVGAKWEDDLLLHLIASHHGAGRPFAPRVEENDAAVSPFIAEIFKERFELPSCRQCPAEWNPVLAERFWRIVRRYGWWGAAYREAVFRLADHTQSAEEQSGPTMRDEPSFLRPETRHERLEPNALPLIGLDGTNPLAFLAALGLLRILSMVSSASRPSWLASEVRLSWNTADRPGVAMLHTTLPVSMDEFTEYLAAHLACDLERHAARTALSLMAASGAVERDQLSALTASADQRDRAEWATAMFSEVAPDANSQLMVVRRDYVEGNFRSVMERTRPDHLFRALFDTWDYADALDNQSLHWEPSEDRRHAYQWYQASGDPTRKKRGGMLGANRLALEAWPLFLSLPSGDRISTRGFHGNRANDTRLTWPLWSPPMNLGAVASLLGIPELQEERISSEALASYGIFQANRCRRILVGKTPNLSAAYAV